MFKCFRFGRVAIKQLVVLCLALIVALPLFSQLENHTWFFGNSSAGIRFNFGTNLPGQFNVSAAYTQNGGCAMANDPVTGAVLFYTNGDFLFNSNHSPVDSMLGGGTGIGQVAKISGVPCNCDHFYVFAHSASSSGGVFTPGTLRSTVVDYSSGSPVVPAATRAVVVLDSVGESLELIAQPNSPNYWLIGRRTLSTEFFVIPVTCSGLGTPVYYDFAPVSTVNDYVYNLRYSAAAGKIAGTYQAGPVITMDFNPVSGVLSNYQQIANGGNLTFDCEWSPDGTKLYYTTFSGISVWQHNFSAVPPANTLLFSSIGQGGGLKLGPDGRIYHIPNIFGTQINRINSPNNAGLAAGYQLNAFGTGVSMNAYKFPQTFGMVLINRRDTLFRDTLCQGSSLQLSDSGGLAYLWTPSTGLSCDTCANPIASPDTSTTYLVNVIYANGCTLVDTFDITVLAAPPAEAGPDTVVCGGVAISLNASGGQSYVWAPTNGLSPPNVPNPTVNPLMTTRYFVTVTDSNACQATDSVLVRVFGIQAGGDTILCQGDSTPLTTTPGAVSYSWSPVAGLSAANIPNPLAFPDSTTDYIVTATDSSGCTVMDTVRITINPAPVVRIALSAPYVCAGSSIQLLASGGTQYQWRPDTTLSSLIIPNPNASPIYMPPNAVDTAWYYLTVTDTNACSKIDSVAVPIRSQPSIGISPDTSVCPGDSVQLFATGASGYLWMPGLSLNDSTLANPLAYPSVPTQYAVVGNDSFGCTDTGYVRVYTLVPQVSPGGAICAGDSLQIWASGGITYSWSPTFGLSSPLNDTTYAFPDSTTSFVVSITDSLGCVGIDSVQVAVNPLPVVMAGPDTTICSGDSVQLIASGGILYSWDPDTTLSSLVIANPMAGPDSSQAYYVTVTHANGCQNRDSVRVGINLPPLANAGPDLTKCGTAGVQLQASGGVSYVWSPVDSLSDPLIANPIADPSDTTTYIVTVTDFLGCVASDTMTVSTMYASASIAIDTVCMGDSIQLMASGGTGYLWTPGRSLSDSLGAAPLAAPDSSTRFRVIVLDPSGCVDSAFVSLAVLPLPQVSAGADTGLCAGQSITLQASGGVAYLWDPDTTLSGGATPSPLVSPVDTTTYFVTVTDSSGCQNRDSVTVEVWPLPIADAGMDSAICAGDTLQLQGSGGGSYAWSPATSLNDSSLADPLAFPAMSTIYTLVVADSNGCEDRASMLLRVDSLPEINPPLQDTMLHCMGDTTGKELAMGLVHDSSLTYSWTPGFGLDDSMAANPILHLPDTFPVGQYPYVLTVSTGAGCSVSDTVVINVVAGSQIPLAGPLSVCPGLSYTYFIPNAPATGYQWQVINGQGTPNANGDSIQVVWNSLADTGVVIVFGGSGPCDGGSVVVQITSPQILSDTVVNPICGGSSTGSIQLVVSGGTAPLTFQWTPGGLGGSGLTNIPAGNYRLEIRDAAGCVTNGNYTLIDPPPFAMIIQDTMPASCGLNNGYAIVQASGGATPYAYLWSTVPPQTTARADNLVSGTYTVSATDANGCSESTQVTIGELPLQRASFTTEPDSGLVLCMPDETTVQFVNTSENATSYFWYFGDGISSPEENPEHTYREEGSYTVILIAFDASGSCPSTDSLTLEVLPASRLFVPNAFTPNDDGYNDFFLVKGVQIIEMEMHIFDRWGGWVASLNSLTDRWDGRLKNGRSAPEGVYAYHLKATFKDGGKVDRGGTITLFR